MKFCAPKVWQVWNRKKLGTEWVAFGLTASAGLGGCWESGEGSLAHNLNENTWVPWPCQERRTRGENERASQKGGKPETHTRSSGWQTREGSWFWPWRPSQQPAPWFLAGSVPSPSPVTSRPLCTISSFAVSMFICLHKMNQSSSWYKCLALLESAKNFDKWRCYKTNPEEYFDALYFNRVICCYISTYLIKFQHQNSREITCVGHD